MSNNKEFKIYNSDQEFIKTLSSNFQQVLKLSAMSYAEISHQINMPIGTVKSRLNRARNKILANRKLRIETLALVELSQNKNSNHQ
jgi:DNA-directed RNA polymerase specialized sigma24 family protein